ncbi:hypothetical protein SEPCBS57363_001930 [Sporothrix epigloea]|uniref:Uncharacterized protein n=1 Tax=Sporothrix epigloea TaxID=1892477 RepID=A0ABP0DEP0_9PEZI
MSSANSPDTKKAMAEITDDDRSGECLTAFMASVQDDHNCTNGSLLEYAKAQRGVYVGSHNIQNGSRAQSILDTINSDEPIEWPQGTLERFARTTDIMTRDVDLMLRIPLSSIHKDFQAIARNKLQDVNNSDPKPPFPASPLPLMLPSTSASPMPPPAQDARMNPQQSLPSQDARINPQQQGLPPTAQDVRFLHQQQDFSAPPPRYGSPVDDLIYHGKTTGQVDDVDQMRIVRDITKSYAEDLKYKGSDDPLSLQYRATLFFRYCKNMTLHELYLNIALPVMMEPGDVF